jgi:hypothetical protein
MEFLSQIMNHGLIKLCFPIGPLAVGAGLLQLLGEFLDDGVLPSHLILVLCKLALADTLKNLLLVLEGLHDGLNSLPNVDEASILRRLYAFE